MYRPSKHTSNQTGAVPPRSGDGKRETFKSAERSGKRETFKSAERSPERNVVKSKGVVELLEGLNAGVFYAPMVIYHYSRSCAALRTLE